MNIEYLAYAVLITIAILLTICLYKSLNFRIVSKQNVYNPTLINSNIKLYYIPDFLTNDECDHIIKLSENKFTKSEVVIGENKTFADSRSSYSHYIERSHDEIINNIETRVGKMVNMPLNCIEPLQVVKYEDGQEFKEHYDWFLEDYMKTIKGNQRKYTFFVYLNDVNNGGHTKFPKLGLSFKPKKGAALFWQNCADKNNCFIDSLHQGESPNGERKYGLNVWINFDPV